MTVKDLMHHLSKFDPDLEVMTDGYEGGIQSPQNPVQTEIITDYHEGCVYMGPHELAEYRDWDDDGPIQTIVYIAR